MKTQHTPGPWAFREGAEPHHQGLIYSEESGHDVAVTYHDEGAANARLIAAAPELLEVLEEIKGRFGVYLSESEVAMSTDYTLLERANEVLQKATQ